VLPNFLLLYICFHYFFGTPIIADTPLCSNGFKYLFNSARVPQPYKDATRCFDPADPRCATVAISRRGQLFTLSILRDATAAEPLCASNILSAAEIEARLRAVIRSAGSSSGSGAAPSLGLLSAVERDEWLQSRNAMLRVGENCAAFDAIDRSLFLLCLDEQSPGARLTVCALE
jgi:carnitine O-acetyltransferase